MTDSAVRAVTARRPHWCDEYYKPRHRINTGDRYVRSAIFPGHDSGYAGQRGYPGARPIVHRLCESCATPYPDLAAAIAADTTQEIR